MQWQRRGALGSEIIEAQAIELSKSIGLPRKLIEILVSRGFDSAEAINEICSPRLKNLRDPLTLRDMGLAVDRLVRAFRDRERICVYADFDLDGSSGLALLVTALRAMNYDNVTYYQPKRLNEGYGVHAFAIEALANDGVSLIITVDVGVTATDAVRRANELGVDMIITDHHLPKEELPKALAIVNPNCDDCTSQLGHLSGVGVAFYLVLALKRELCHQGLFTGSFDPKDLLDFFVIGTLTDMVPLVDENRPLVRHGLKRLAQTDRSGLRALLSELDLYGKDLTSQDVAIQFAPKLNALSRMEVDILPVDIFFEEDPAEALRKVSVITSNNLQRKKLQASAEALALELVQPSKGYALAVSEEFHKGVIGLVATKLTQKFGVPSFVGVLSDEGIVLGSARVPEGSEINLLKIFEENSPCFLRFGGHAKAAGFSMSKVKLAEFEEGLVAKGLETKPSIVDYDIEIDLAELNARFLNSQMSLEPFGQNFPQPRYRIRTVVKRVTEMSGGHLKLLTELGRELVYFSPPAEFSGSGEIEALVRLQKNYFRGRESIQVLVDAARHL